MKTVRESQSNRAPLDELVMSQLKVILACEEQLKNRFQVLSEAPSSDPRTLAIELSNLQVRADRLARVLDALDGNYTPAAQLEQETPWLVPTANNFADLQIEHHIPRRN